jgi:hypothetical protein
MKLLGKIFATLILLFFVGRAIAEPFVTRPGSDYHSDWGGPTYVGVLAVHMLPGILAIYLIWLLWRKHAN